VIAEDATARPPETGPEALQDEPAGGPSAGDNAEAFPDLDVQVQLLLDLPPEGLLRRFPGLDFPSGELPQSPVRPPFPTPADEDAPAVF